MGGDRYPDSAASGLLSDMVGWRDFWSVRYAKVRILNDIRRCGLELERIPWQDPRAAISEAERIINTYQGRYVPRKLPYLRVCCEEEECEIRLNLLSAAVACASFQAVHGRLPKTWEESGLSPSVTWGIHLDEGGLFLPGSTNAIFGFRFAQEWPIGRRK
jgi:hypothetical protein